MKKIQNYLSAFCALFFLHNTYAAENLEQSCYYGEKAKKETADKAIENYKLAIEELSQARNFGDKMRALNKSKETLKVASSIGHPDALAMKCQSGMDNLAPADMRDNGKEWCKFGIETIPSLKEKLPVSFVEELNGLNYTERTNTKCLTSKGRE